MSISYFSVCSTWSKKFKKRVGRTVHGPLGYDGFFFCFLNWGFFFHFIACGLSPSVLGYDGFFLFFSWGFFFHFIALGLSPSGLGYEGFCLFFDFGIVFFSFLAFRLSPSGQGYYVFFLFFDLGLLFPFYCLCFKLVRFRL